MYYLQEHFDGEDAGEHIVEVVEDEISVRTSRLATGSLAAYKIRHYLACANEMKTQ